MAEIIGNVAGFYSNYDRTYNYVGMRGISVPKDYNTRVADKALYTAKLSGKNKACSAAEQLSVHTIMN